MTQQRLFHGLDDEPGQGRFWHMDGKLEAEQPAADDNDRCDACGMAPEIHDEIKPCAAGCGRYVCSACHDADEVCFACDGSADDNDGLYVWDEHDPQGAELTTVEDELRTGDKPVDDRTPDQVLADEIYDLLSKGIYCFQHFSKSAIAKMVYSTSKRVGRILGSDGRFRSYEETKNGDCWFAHRDRVGELHAGPRFTRWSTW